jgi:hypothetical protein
MLKVSQRFGKHSSCHLQAECLGVGVESLYIDPAVGDEWAVKDVTGRTEERIAIY